MKNAFRSYFYGLKVNKIIEYLTISDIVLLSGWGMVTPIIAVFFAENIEGGSVALAGLASTVYFLTKSILQLPFARYIDKKKGEWDDYIMMVAGTLTISLCAFLYIIASLPWHVMAIQVIYGIGGALSYPSWVAIFTRHIDKNEEGFEWSLYYTTTDLGAAAAAGIGGLMAASFGYNTVFLVVGIMSLAGTAFLAGLEKTSRNNGELLLSFK
jgi:MFS family permease